MIKDIATAERQLLQCRRHHLRILSSLLFVIFILVHLVVCSDKTINDESYLDEQKRSTEVSHITETEESVPKYDLVLALIEKYLKERSARKLQKENDKNPSIDSLDSGCRKETELNEMNSSSISYPSVGTYLNNEDCQWHIQAPVDKVIELTVRRLSIEATEECRWDKLELFDGNSVDTSRLLTSLCGFVLPAKSYISSGNEVVVKFSSDDSIGYGGFQIDFRLIPRQVPDEKQDKSIKGALPAANKYSAECPAVKELKEKNDVIKFPLSGNYDNNLACKWRILAPAGKVIQLQITSIDIEAPEECPNCCWFDWLSVYDGRTENASSLMTKLCGTTVPSNPLTTSSNAALVVFRSNAKNGDEGFLLNYQIIQKDKAKSGPGFCAGQVSEIRKPKGTLRSPGFDEGKFPENAHCRWRIIAPAGQVVRVKFESLNVENDLACVYDSLTFYDGFNRSAPLIGKFCGNKLPADITTSNPTLLMSFESDSSMSEGGFSISWEFVDKDAVRNKATPGCGEETAVLQETEGFFTSPNYGKGNEYPNAAKCSWRITVDASQRIFLRFEKFSLEPPLFDTECYDVVHVYDGPNTEAPLLGSYCGVYAPNDLMASGNQLYISFQSDKSTKAPGFLIRYSAKNAADLYSGDCGVPDVMPKVYSRIVGGVEATPHSWPWQVSMKYSGLDWHHWCGGSMLYPHWVITAAHCVHGYGPASNFRVVLGEHNQLVKEGPEKELEVQEIIIHEKFDSDTNDNDIALFRLPEDVQYNRFVKPICLPKDDVEVNVLCIITGWGDTKSTGNASLLNQVYVPVISRIQCNQPTWYRGQVTDNMICAGYPEGRKDSCQGDSGGPMVCLSDGRWRLNGVTSFGYDCALSNHPGIYTRVTRYLGWIQSKTGHK